MDRRPRDIHVVNLLDLADRAISVCLARATGTANLTREQWRALVLLDEGVDTDGVDAPGHTMGEIAERAVVPAPTATRMVDKLVADGLAYRRSDDWDRRRVLVHISAAGHTLVERTAADLDEAFGSMLDGLDPTGRIDLVGLLQRLGDVTGTGEPGRTA